MSSYRSLKLGLKVSLLFFCQKYKKNNYHQQNHNVRKYFKCLKEFMCFHDIGRLCSTWIYFIINHASSPALRSSNVGLSVIHHIGSGWNNSTTIGWSWHFLATFMVASRLTVFILTVAWLFIGRLSNTHDPSDFSDFSSCATTGCSCNSEMDSQSV